jgi:glycolate oxidase iron-sulfur subunit
MTLPSPDSSSLASSLSPSPSMPSTPHTLVLDGLNACIHCGICLPACPTYKATGSEAESPRGRLYLMQKLLTEEITAEAVEPHLDNCLACHGCETVCPSGVQYGKLLMETREVLAHSDRSLEHRFKRLIFRWLLPKPGLLRLGGTLLRFYQCSGLQRWVRASGLLKLIPNLAAREALTPIVPEHRMLSPGQVFGDPTGELVVLPLGCIMDVFYNPVHWDTITVLTANGYRVHIPENACCGALAHHAGDVDITRSLAVSMMEKLLRPNPRWIVMNSAGCGSSMKEYPHLLAGDATQVEIARRFAEKVVDVTELLAQKPLAPFQRTLDNRIAYHAACHLYHVQGVKTQPVALLEQIPGVTLVPLQNAEACCGSAGIYNIEHPELSQEILAAKMDTIRAVCLPKLPQQDAVSNPLVNVMTSPLTDACLTSAMVLEKPVDTIATGNPGCLLQLEKGVREAGLPLQIRHPISILAEAYRSDPT